jgi:hypothetical protein
MPNSPFANVYELLDAARDRPGMHGIGARSYVCLRAFLAGLSWGGCLDAGDPPFTDFPWWAEARYGRVPTSGPLHWLTRDRSDADAYDRWFAMLDEYRTCRLVEFARLPGTMARRPRSCTIVDGIEAPFERPSPDAIVLGRYEPFEVFFAAEWHEGRRELLRDAVRPTLADTLDEARSAWDVSPDAWPLASAASAPPAGPRTRTS